MVFVLTSVYTFSLPIRFYNLQMLRELRISELAGETSEAEREIDNIQTSEIGHEDTDQSYHVIDNDDIPMDEDVHFTEHNAKSLMAEQEVQTYKSLMAEQAVQTNPTARFCLSCKEKKLKIESLQRVTSKQRKRLYNRRKLTRDLQRENRHLKKVHIFWLIKVLIKQNRTRQSHWSTPPEIAKC